VLLTNQKTINYEIYIKNAKETTPSVFSDTNLNYVYYIILVKFYFNKSFTLIFLFCEKIIVFFNEYNNYYVAF
jgi:hypothetical protein